MNAPSAGQRNRAPRQQVLQPGCKINLYLRILGRRPDGMHELETLFHPLSAPSDRIEVTPQEAGAGLRFTCSQAALAGEDNLVVRACKGFAAASGWAPDLQVHLEKRTPTGAGLGGGSADAAAMLRYCNEAAGSQALDQASLHRLATNLGADVPFFLQDEPALARGVGEVLQPVPQVRELLAGLTLLLCMPEEPVATGWAYSAWDALFLEDGGGLTAPLPAGIGSFCLEALVLFNSFEAAVMPAHPRLGALKDELLRRGAQGALLSGSGSSVFGLFRQAAQARAAHEALTAAGMAAVCIQASTGVSPSR